MCIIPSLPSTFILHLHLTCDQGTTDNFGAELFYLLNIVATCRMRKYFMHQHINFTDKSFISPSQLWDACMSIEKSFINIDDF